MRTDIHGNEPLCALVPSVSRCFEPRPDQVVVIVYAEIKLSIILVPEMVPPHNSKRHSSAPFILL